MQHYRMIIRTNTASVPELEHKFDMASDKMASDYVAILIRNHFSRTPWFHYCSLFQEVAHPGHKGIPAMGETIHVNDFYPAYGVEPLRNVV